MTEKEKIKRLLPKGSYQKIAQKIGRSYGTVRDYFAPSKDFSISEQVEENLLREAKKIIEASAWKALEIAHGKEKTKAAKAAIKNRSLVEMM